MNSLELSKHDYSFAKNSRGSPLERELTTSRTLVYARHFLDALSGGANVVDRYYAGTG
jgi:hypothetical protein